MNNLVLVGRLTKDVELETSENGKKMCKFVIAVTRPFKNMEGVYETDFIKCMVFDNMAITLSEYCKKGDLIGVKGRLYCDDVDNNMAVYTEKLTFLSARKESE